ncbi:alpha/beta hydrolase [bacterium]|nr:alpha/beta hydrolase [bacterium]
MPSLWNQAPPKLTFLPARGPSPSSRTVLLIHGLERFPHTMTLLGWRFQRAGWNALLFDYPCHTIHFTEAGNHLEVMLKELPPVQHPTHGIGFSMGGVLLHALLKKHPIVPRAIYAGSPLLSCQAAERVARFLPFADSILGPSLKTLAEKRPFSLPAATEVGVIAGSGIIGGSWNPLLSGANDGIVRVEEALPPLVTEQITVPSIHLGLVMKKKPFQLMEHFLSCGSFPKEEDGMERL